MIACAKAWSKSMGCEIGELVLHVERRNILQEWGYDCTSEKRPPSKGIPVHLFFPISLIEGKETVTINERVSEYGVRHVEVDDLSVLPVDVPLTIFFHGGAFVLGDAYSGWVSLISPLMEKENNPIIVASVDYSLAPEYPFPTAVEEALSVVSYFLDNCPDRRVHISGLSAGGSLAAVAAMESFRKYPDRIASVLIGTAYIDPKADSLSYYMNRDSSHLPTVGLLRWGWQAYLEMPPNKDKEPETIASAYDALGVDSNRTAWKECKWNRKPVERLISPQVDLPTGLDRPNAPRIIITTNQADPLLDECLDLLSKLTERSANVKHFDHIGTHWMGTELDKALLGEVVDEWANVLFDKK